jgi:hypothetical protein
VAEIGVREHCRGPADAGGCCLISSKLGVACMYPLGERCPECPLIHPFHQRWHIRENAPVRCPLHVTESPHAIPPFLIAPKPLCNRSDIGTLSLKMSSTRPRTINRDRRSVQIRNHGGEHESHGRSLHSTRVDAIQPPMGWPEHARDRVKCPPKRRGNNAGAGAFHLWHNFGNKLIPLIICIVFVKNESK